MIDKPDYVGAAILRGASARWFGNPITENPYPQFPGSYVLHNAWHFGWTNSEEVIEANDTGRHAADELARHEGAQ